MALPVTEATNAPKAEGIVLKQAFDRCALRRLAGARSFEREADPATLRPKIRKLNRDVAAFLRANPATDVEQERLPLPAIETEEIDLITRMAIERENVADAS